MVAGFVGRAVSATLDRLEDGRALAAIERALPVLIRGEETTRIVTRALKATVDSELHQEALSALLESLKKSIKKSEVKLRRFIEERVREQGGRVVGWAIVPSVASRVLTALYMELDHVDPKNSGLRESFTAWLRQEISRLETDPDLKGRLSDMLLGFFGHESLKAWWSEIWIRFRTVARSDLRGDDGWHKSVIESIMVNFAEQLERDPAMQAKVEEAILAASEKFLPSLRVKLSTYIASVMERWDPRELSEKLEARVGQDLHYIRVNGTLVGFVVGAALDIFLHVCFPSVN